MLKDKRDRHRVIADGPPDGVADAQDFASISHPSGERFLGHMCELRLARCSLPTIRAERQGEGALAALVVVERLVRNGRARKVTEFHLGSRVGGERRVMIEWEDPRVYSRVEPERRRLEGQWRR